MANYLQFYLFQCHFNLFFFSCIHYNIILFFFFIVFIGIEQVSVRLLVQRFIVIKLIMHICIGKSFKCLIKRTTPASIENPAPRTEWPPIMQTDPLNC